MENGNSKPRGSLVWPLVLIGIGVLFLLNNLGVVDWEVWPTLLRLWPLLLVAVGLDLLLGRRSGIWAGVTVAIVLAMFAGGIWLVQTTTGVWVGELVTHEISQPLEGADQADVYINMGVGIIEIDAMSSDTQLVMGMIEVAEDEEVRESYQVNDGVGDYELTTRGQEYYPSWLANDNWEGDKNWSLSLNDDVLLDLTIDSGVGVCELDLSELQLSSLSLDAGVGETTVFLPAAGQYSVKIDAGVGQVTVHIPAGIGIRMTLDTGLGNTSITGEFSQRNGVYYTEGFEDAEDFVELSVEGGIGEIVIIQED